MFQKVFEDKKDLLELYNAVNGTSYTNPEELEITTLDEAVEEAMERCIEKNVLADILLKCKSEVYNMLLTEFDEKKYYNTVKNEGREEAKEELIRTMYQNGFDVETIARGTNIPSEKITEIVNSQ